MFGSGEPQNQVFVRPLSEVHTLEYAMFNYWDKYSTAEFPRQAFVNLLCMAGKGVLECTPLKKVTHCSVKIP